VSESGVPSGGRLELRDGWKLTGTPPGACDGPDALAQSGWVAAPVPGTVAGALAAAELDVDAQDWWYRLEFDADRAEDGEEIVLALDGIATVAEVFLNGRRILASESMFAAHRLDVGARLNGRNELAICCRALTPRLKERRKPRARWRTKLVAEGNLRFFRTMLIGRAPGFAPGPAVVGLWRPVALERRRGLVVQQPRLRARVDGTAGVLECHVPLRALPGSEPPERLPVTVTRAGDATTGELAVAIGTDGTAAASGTVTVPGAELWWPHTHGTPALYGVTIGDAADPLYRTRVGFRTLVAATDLLADGPDLRINGVRVFARGAVWTPLDQLDPHASPVRLRQVLDTVVDGGLNMLRIPGIGAYESGAFHDLCDELGILVWQDFMFANLDYPEQDPEFMAAVTDEARTVLAALAPRPSLAVLCGGSEVAQQVAMLGLDPALANGPLYGELLPALVGEAEIDAPYVPSAPWGGDLPFRTDRGVANYYGVGAYLRPLQDARRAEVRFAAECLAFANVPDEPALAEVDATGGIAVHHPAWKAGVPRDAGAGWDFDDVRDHYLHTLFDVDPVSLRYVDPERYLELSRAVSGEVMAEVFGEWRRRDSPCAGGLVLWLKDLRPGAGWGVLDHRGEPKVAYHHLRRALAPVAVWSTDEGLGGVHAHVANDRQQSLTATLRVALYQDLGTRVAEASRDLRLHAHETMTIGVEEILGRFVDASWAYRFGPPGHDLIICSLQQGGDDGPLITLSHAARFPVSRPTDRFSAARLGASGTVRAAGDDALIVTVSSTGLLYGARVTVPGHVPDDDAFVVEPGHPRAIVMRRVGRADQPGSGDPGGSDSAAPGTGRLTALNLAGHVAIVPEAAG
jgi:beta-mannosidase